MVDLCRALRHEGLNLNEAKTRILPSNQLLYEETQIDDLFEAARDEIEGNIIRNNLYGFQSYWFPDGAPVEDEEVELRALEALYVYVDTPEAPVDQIERFCLPLLALGQSEIAINRALQGVIDRPHLAKQYCSYLLKMGRYNQAVVTQIENILLGNGFSYDWQIMWVVGTLIYLQSVSARSVTVALRYAQDHTRSVALRAVCVLLVGKHGSAVRRRTLKSMYADEPSPYVRSALLYASKDFPAPERSTCLRAWGGHSSINALVARAVNKTL
jgi:hypothetical protein